MTLEDLIKQELHPDWQTHGKAAGPIRNGEIVERCDRVVAFWDGKSRETLDTIRRATRAGKHVEVIGPNAGEEVAPLTDGQTVEGAEQEADDG